MILFADYNTPYLFAISFVLLIGLLGKVRISRSFLPKLTR